MSKAYSLVSWNVEHFGKNKGIRLKNRVKKVAAVLKRTNADVFALYEVRGSHVFTEMISEFPDYTFHITEGPQSQEILVAVRNGFSAFFTQKTEFKSGVTILRPGALLTLTIDGKHYPILFLHLKSADDPRSFGLRDDMIRRATKFMKKLGKNANYLFIGDLNTMGMNYYQKNDFTGDLELLKADTYASRYHKMRRLDKTFPYSYNNGSKSIYPQSALDHCYAADHLTFKMFDNKDRNGKSPVDIRGWVDEAAISQQDKWIGEYSDHAMLYIEVQKV